MLCVCVCVSSEFVLYLGIVRKYMRLDMPQRLSSRAPSAPPQLYTHSSLTLNMASLPSRPYLRAYTISFARPPIPLLDPRSRLLLLPPCPNREPLSPSSRMRHTSQRPLAVVWEGSSRLWHTGYVFACGRRLTAPPSCPLTARRLFVLN